jgi:protein-tyrosine-phosphatase
MNQIGRDGLLPPEFEYLTNELAAFRKQFRFIDRNVFVMMPFQAPAADQIYNAARDAIEHYGLVALRADQRQFSPWLWWNVVTYMFGSSYGIAIYQPEGKVPFNPNVSIEAGFMLARGVPVLLLANKKLKSRPVDFSGRTFRPFDPEDIARTVHDVVSDWIEHDISYYSHEGKKLITFVSLGGTCRCVMAKAILSDRLQRKGVMTAVVEAAAAADPVQTEISPSAVIALEEIGCGAWIEHHRPRKMCQYLRDKSDLIIALTDSPIGVTDSKKVVTDRVLFGAAVPNPAPDNRDSASLKKYRDARIAIESAIDNHFDEILDRAGARPIV